MINELDSVVVLASNFCAGDQSSTSAARQQRLAAAAAFFKCSYAAQVPSCEMGLHKIVTASKPNVSFRPGLFFLQQFAAFV